MKKITLTLITALFYMGLYAQKVSEADALIKAQKFLKGKTIKKAPLKQKVRGENGFANSEEPFYVFNAEDNQGFVIVSGDSRTEEILGYSDKGNINFDNMPDNMRAWLDGYAEQIRAIGNIPMENKSENKVNRPAIPYLIKTEWSQWSPYNDLCPEVDGRRCPTGCVAIALAQIMYYYKHPKDEIPEIPEYTTKTYKINVPKLEPTIIQWDKLRDTYPSHDQEEQYEIAKLMRYCGQAVRMDYGPTESKSSLFGEPGVSCYLDFSSSRKSIARREMSSADWENTLYTELSEGRPVYLSASSHAFICDGYNENGLFHINWGWGGEDNGYYLISLLCPDSWDRNDDIHLSAFVQDLKAIINLRPYDASDWNLSGWAEFSGFQNLNRNNTDEDFTLFIISSLYSDFDRRILYEGELAIGFYKEDELYQIVPCEFLMGSDVKDWKGKFGAGQTDGTYQIQLLIKDNNTGEWLIANTNEYWLFEFTEKEAVLTKVSKEVESYYDSNIEIQSVKVIDNLEQDCKIMTIYLKNFGKSYAQILTLWLDDVKIATRTAFVDPGESGFVSFKFYPNVYGKKDYEIRLKHDSDNETIYETIYHGKILLNPYTYFIVEPFWIEPENTATCYVKLKGKKEEQFVGYSFKASLPEGLSFEQGEEAIVSSDFAKKNNLQLKYTYQDNACLFEILSKESDPIFSEGDTLIVFRIKADKDIDYGVKTILLEEVSGQNETGEAVNLCSKSTDFRVTCPPLTIETKAGELAQIIRDDKKFFVSRLKLKGTLNGSDFKLLRDMAGNNYQGQMTDGLLKWLDLSEVSITAGGDKYLEANEVYVTENFITTGGFYSLESDDIIPKEVFVGCNFEEVKLPYSVSDIQNNAFWSCHHLKKIFIPNGIERIGRNAFRDCNKLTDVILPSSLIHSVDGAFNFCKNISTIICSTEDPINLLFNIWDKVIFSTATLIVPKGAKAKYLERNYWKEFKNIQEEDFIRVKANSLSIESGDDIPVFTYTVEGGTLDGGPHFYCEADGKTPGNYDIKILQGSVSNEYVIFENGVLTVNEKSSYKSGDANSDGNVDAADIKAVVDYILTGKTDGFNFDNANMNGDTKVDAADLVLLINMMK